jgi:methyltransferase family protein
MARRLRLRFRMLHTAALFDPNAADSFSARLRRRRFRVFRRLLDSVPGRLHILDVGGTETFWRHMGMFDARVEILLLNLDAAASTTANVRSRRGDAREMSEFPDRSFDIVFSNSVIEHVGGHVEQQRMAAEIRRLGRRYFLQTPNYFFPVEPHFLTPGFQFLPLAARAWLVRRFRLGWFGRESDRERSLEIADSIRLLTRSELREMFPGATIAAERFCGLTKSFMVYDGWT